MFGCHLVKKQVVKFINVSGLYYHSARANLEFYFYQKQIKFFELLIIPLAHASRYTLIQYLDFRLALIFTAWKVSKYGVISGPYFPVFSPNKGIYGPEITPYLDTFHAVIYLRRLRIEPIWASEHNKFALHKEKMQSEYI